jgi:hypothetical protein
MKPVAESFDIAVVGGGSAGLAAAVTAARSGARVLLVERYGYLGGMGTASLVHTFCGLYLLRAEPGAVLANPGFPAEIAERMILATGIGPQRVGRVDILPQHPVEFVKIADDLVSAESTLELRLHCELTGVSQTGSGWEIRMTGRGGARSCHAGKLIDASGDAVVADLLDMDFAMTESPRLQRPAYLFGVQGVTGFDDEARLQTVGLIVEAVRNGELVKDAYGLSFRESGRVGEIFGSLDLHGGDDYDPFDDFSLSGLEMKGRSVAAGVVKCLSRKSALWKNAYISHWPIRAGVRESRRWIGEATLTGNDLLKGNRFGDEVALATWPMEFRENTRGPKLRFPEENRPAGIPLGCLKPRGVDGLFVAGRCISTDHDAQASIRVMGTCFATGEAAGKAAALES